MRMVEIRLTHLLLAATTTPSPRRTYRAPVVQRGTVDVFVQRRLVPGTPVPLGSQFSHAALDPILDIPCVGALWRQCTALVDHGAHFPLSALAVHVYVAPSLGVTTQNEVPQAVLRPNVCGIILERMLYLVPRAELDTDLLARAVQTRWVQHVQLADIHDAADSAAPAHDTGLHLPPWTDDNWGDWPLADLRHASRDFWLTPRAALPFTLAPEFTALAQWLADHCNLLHPADGWKLLRWLRAVKAGLQHGRVPNGQYEAWIDHLVGHLAEIIARKNILAEFLDDAAAHPHRVLCVEPQVQTPDGRYASDLLVGDLDSAARTLQLVHAHEVTSNATHTEKTRAQMRTTLKRRYPALGVRILGDAHAQNFARLHIATHAAMNTDPISIDDDSLRPLAAHVLDTVRAWRAITDAALADLPRAVATGVRHTTNDLHVVGKIAMAAMRILLADFAAQCQHAKRVELSWLHHRVTAAIAQSHSPLVRTQLQRMATVAENLIAREGHVRASVGAVARQLKTVAQAIRNWEKIFMPILDVLHIPLAERTGLAASIVKGQKLSFQVAALCEAWAKSDAPVATLVAQVRAVDPDRATVLENLLAREGHVRASAGAVARQLKTVEPTISSWQKIFLPVLTARHIPLAEYTGQAAATVKGKKLSSRVAALCEAWAKSDAPVATLVAQIRAMDPDHATVLENLLAREGHVRASAAAVAKTLKTFDTNIHRREKIFTSTLNARHIPVARRSEHASHIIAARAGRKAAVSIPPPATEGK